MYIWVGSAVSPPPMSPAVGSPSLSQELSIPVGFLQEFLLIHTMQMRTGGIAVFLDCCVLIQRSLV